MGRVGQSIWVFSFWVLGCGGAGMGDVGRMGLDAFWSASVAPKVLREFAASLLLRAKEKSG